MMAFKCLDRKHGQGDIEFWKEIMMLSQYKHEHLISLQHFCNEEGERILVYEYAPRGSLDHRLGDISLTWIQRLKICHGAACGLNYLHDPMEMHQRVLHRDVKSSNILLDENLTAKISDFGLSKFGPANQKYTYLVSNTVGTPGYCDPMYMEMGSLSKESDVYSFGVVLFEVMCGRRCFKHHNTEFEILVPTWKQCYEENRLDDIVFNDLKEQIDRDSLITFSSIAYRCLHRDRKQRPTFAEIIDELEIALDHQEMSQDIDERSKFKERMSIANQATPPIPWRSRNELASVLYKGILLNEGDHWLSLNKNGEYCVMITGDQYFLHDHKPNYWVTLETGRFRSNKKFPCISLDSNFCIQASPRFLSPHVTYSVNLVCKYFSNNFGDHVPLKYKLHTETEYWRSCVAQRRGEWLSIELYQFTSYQKEHDFRFDILGQLNFHDRASMLFLFLIGIEFLPLEQEKDENVEEKDKGDKQPVVDLDGYWVKKLSDDYADLIKWSKYDMLWTTNKELYYLLRKGFLIIKNGKQWFSVSKNMKKRLMLPAKAVLEGPTWKSLLGRKHWTWKLVPESRFEWVAESYKMKSFTIDCNFESRLLSLETAYACYLVYKLPREHSMVNGLLRVACVWRRTNYYDGYVKIPLVDLIAPTYVPFIIDKDNANVAQIPLKTHRIKGHPKLRKDGWMEIQIWLLQTMRTLESQSQSPEMIRCCWNFEYLSHDQWSHGGLVVQGIEIKPAKVTFRARAKDTLLL